MVFPKKYLLRFLFHKQQKFISLYQSNCPSHHKKRKEVPSAFYDNPWRVPVLRGTMKPEKSLSVHAPH